MHGALVDVDGMGVLLLGRSGIGKSECALELVSRGHRLVADDIVELRPGPDGRVIGSAPERVRHYMEIRGLGIVFIPDLFGPEGVREEMPIDLVCQLEKWTEGAEYERIGLERATQRIGGASIPSVTLPARPGGSMASVIEVAARDHFLKNRAISISFQKFDCIHMQHVRFAVATSGSEKSGHLDCPAEGCCLQPAGRFAQGQRQQFPLPPSVLYRFRSAWSHVAAILR